jgi:hypothetical protein
MNRAFQVLSTTTRRKRRDPSVINMKILVYSMNFWPEPTSTGKYSGEMAV